MMDQNGATCWMRSRAVSLKHARPGGKLGHLTLWTEEPDIPWRLDSVSMLPYKLCNIAIFCLLSVGKNSTSQNLRLTSGSKHKSRMVVP